MGKGLQGKLSLFPFVHFLLEKKILSFRLFPGFPNKGDGKKVSVSTTRKSSHLSAHA